MKKNIIFTIISILEAELIFYFSTKLAYLYNSEGMDVNGIIIE